jgi:integrase
MGVKVRHHRGAWWLFIDRGGKRKAKRIGDRATANRVAQAIRERFARGDLALPPLGEGQTLRSYSENWLKGAQGNLKATTVRFYRNCLDRHLLPALGDRVVASLRRADCRDLVLACRAKGLKIGTVRGIARTLSAVLSQAVEDELLPANPALRLGRHLRRGDEPAPEPNPFTRDESALLVETAWKYFPEWHAFILCGLRTGLRLGEMLALQWGDVDWRGRFIRIQRNLPEGQSTLSTPKNHQARRVDMSPLLRLTLRAWRRGQSREWFTRGLSRPLWIFPSADRTPLDESNVRKALNRVLDKAGLHRRGPHQMRHTFASLLLQAGAPITYVSQQLGHRDSAITLRVYARWLPDASLRKDVDRLDDIASDATIRNPDATTADHAAASDDTKSFVVNGEPRRNRTFNPQIKSLLLCQLS